MSENRRSQGVIFLTHTVVFEFLVIFYLLQSWVNVLWYNVVSLGSVMYSLVTMPTQPRVSYYKFVSHTT